MTFSASVRAVTFDVGGTLIEPWPSVGHVYAEVAAKYGRPGISPELLNRNFAVEWKKKQNFQHTEADWAGLVDSTFADLLDTPPSRTFFPVLYGRFAEPNAWRVCGDVLPALDHLASRQLSLAIISNWDERLRPLLQRLGLHRYFDTITVSCEVAFAKPSPVIFEVAAQKLGIPAENILHVGDNRNEDVDGARSAGFQALMIDRSSNDRGGDVIASLEDLAALL